MIALYLIVIIFGIWLYLLIGRLYTRAVLKSVNKYEREKRNDVNVKESWPIPLGVTKEFYWPGNKQEEEFKRAIRLTIWVWPVFLLAFTILPYLFILARWTFWSRWLKDS